MVAGDGLIQLPSFFEYNAQVVVRLTEIRLEGEGLVVGGDGVVQPSQFPEHVSKIVVCLDEIRLDIKNLSVDCLRLLQLSGLMQLKAFLSKPQKFIRRDTTPSLSRGLRWTAAFFFKGLPGQVLLMTFFSPVHNSADIFHLAHFPDLILSKL